MAQVERVRLLHVREVVRGGGRVDLPWALARKYPHASGGLGGQYVFPASRTSVDWETGDIRRTTAMGRCCSVLCGPRAAGPGS